MGVNQQRENELDINGRNKQRFVFCSVPNTDWEEVLTVYRANPTGATVDNNIPSILEKQQQEMSLHQQHMILNQIPNLHKWPWNNSSTLNITHPQKFSVSSRRYPFPTLSATTFKGT